MSIHRPATREELKEFCLRQLGHPVIEINVDDDQIEDCIENALQFWREYHFDAVEQIYLKAQVTASECNVASTVGFVAPETIRGQTSGATAKLSATTPTLFIYNIKGQFQDGETIVGETTGSTTTLNSITLGSFDNKYFDLSDAVTGVTRVLPFSNRSTGINIFDIRYQILINDLYSMMSTDLIYYSQVRQHLELINQLLVGQKPIRFNRHMNRLYVDMDWDNDVDVGGYVIAECTRILDPNDFTDVYNDMYLKRYAVALIKRIWGVNMKKFEGVQLPGGVMLNGQRIYDEAVEEIAQIEQEIRGTFEEPPIFMMG